MHDDHPLSAVDTIVGGNPGGGCMPSMDTDGDDMMVVQDNSTLLLNYYQ
jgi:hypothetical protein